MSRKMFSVLRRPALTWFKLRKSMQQNHGSTIYSKPPRERIGPVQSVFAICVFAVTLLGPAGWILHHIPEYRQRPPPRL
ncbi:COX8 domain-containing protein [Chelmon rostratus]|uniref:COX8 domain-containing protein n=1 Tax=Chelmon rostratus TaxID=109905 RepID=UPI001BE5A0CA|nr:COX8 domain-containing protein [Chelmon rostratus]